MGYLYMAQCFSYHEKHTYLAFPLATQHLYAGNGPFLCLASLSFDIEMPAKRNKLYIFEASLKIASEPRASVAAGVSA